MSWLADKRILVAEDEPLIGLDLEDGLAHRRGAYILGW